MFDPDWVLVPLAAGMAVSIAYLVRWASEARTPLKAGTVVFLLLMMVGMLLGGAIYYATPSLSGFVEGIWVASAFMSLSVVVVFLSFLREIQAENRAVTAAPALPPTEPAPPGARFIIAVIVLALANELLMGWTFTVASGVGVPSTAGYGAGLANVFTASVNSPWFLFTMSAEMLLTSVFLRRRLTRPVFAVLVAQSIIMLLSPPALNLVSWTAISIYLGSGAMIILFVYLMEFLYRHPQIGDGFSTYLVELLGVYGLMMGGLFLWQYYAVGSVFAVAIVLEMIVFFAAVIRPEELTRRLAKPWQLRAPWVFAVLSAVFVAELFMGAVLDVQVDPATYLGGFPVLALSGSASAVLWAVFYNGFWFIATVTASTWFLVMMGLEMGMLVVFKYRETRHLENRVRLLLMLGSYAAFAVFYPSLYFQAYFPNAPPPSQVPVLGWSMGIGSYPLAIGVFGVVLLTYVITGALSALFGRRVVCSVFCTAPLMYQGTTVDSMKSFNRSGAVGRKYLSSRLSSLYGLTTGLVLTSLVGASLLSYLDTTGVTHILIAGVDPTLFLFALYFSVVWYLMFVSIPYMGNYNCVTMGWCYTGTIAQAFQKVGFFKLKVRSKRVCQECTTLDCAKNCPVALVDMPGHFRSTGEFRSSKCCGVGDCIEACPYDNIYISDVRDWFRTRLGLPAPPVRARQRLPMVGARPPTAVAAAVPAPPTANPATP